MTLDLANWMGQLEPIMGEATLLDLSLPGAHDAMTYDLSDTLSDGYEGIDAVVSDLLHDVTPLVAGEFVRAQGQTQGINMTSFLDAGVRFIDFRIMYTHEPDTVWFPPQDWYCLHGTATQHKAITYLQQARQWLDAHPKEIVVFWASRHGDNGDTGTDQYPDTTPAQRQAFFSAVQGVFKDMMFDASLGRLNETSVATLLERGQRVVWYAADYAESTANSTFALDGRKIDNQLPGAGSSFGSLPMLRSGAARLASDRGSDRFFLMSLAQSGSTCEVEAAAEVYFLPLGKDSNRAKCAACFNIPGMDSWCPMTLQDVAQLTNYYNHVALDVAYNEAASNTDVDFPHAIYIDGIDVGGLIRTGTDRLNPLTSMDGVVTTGGHGETGYAYSATVIGMTVRRLCRQGSDATACSEASTAVEVLRARAPLQRWDDATHGRLSDWPAVPAPSILV
jgi:hypothetical protein